MKKKFSRLRRLKLQDLVPFIAFVAIFLFLPLQATTSAPAFL